MKNISFAFDHSSLSSPALQAIGIRSLKWVEESFFDDNSALREITETGDKFRVFVSIGFCKAMIPLLYVFEVDDKINSILVRKATQIELKKYYC